MDNESIFTVSKVDIEFKNYNEPIYVWIFGDIHRFAPMCYEESWFEFIDQAKKTPNCYFLGMGDYDDLASTSERFLLNNKQLHDSTKFSLDDYARERTMKLVEEIKFMKGRLIGLIEGNHYWETDANVTTTQMMCEALGCKYLAGAAFIRLRMKYAKGARQAHVDVWAHHGAGGGGGRTAGATVNGVQKFSNVAVADIYVCGHDHQSVVRPKERLVLVEGHNKVRVQNRPIYYLRSGSFLAAYRPNKSSYAVKRGYEPARLGAVKLELTPKLRQRPDLGIGADETVIEIHATT